MSRPTLGELADFLREEELSLHISYSGESADIVNKRTWAAILRVDRKPGGIVSVSAPANTLEAAVARVIEMWRSR